MIARIISSLVAILILFASAYYFDQKGLYVVCTYLGMYCAFEYGRMAFGLLKGPMHIRVVHFLLTFAIFCTTVWADEYSFSVLAVATMIFLTCCMLLITDTTNMAKALNLQSVGLMGFLYTGVFTAIVTKTVQLPGGPIWLYMLLATVFAGDTFAYLIGKTFGKRPLLPSVSPKKTVEGAIAGLFGSAIAMVVFKIFFLQQISLNILIPTAIATGVFAQIGDLFESLIKRWAEVKDSGTLMPGHGGALDRLDGVLFAAPIYYAMFRFFID